MPYFAAPAHSRLFAQFAEALADGETGTRVDTPAFRPTEMRLGEVIGDLIGGDRGQDVVAHLLRVLAVAQKSPDTDTRLHAMAACAALSRMHADLHAEAGDLDDADADDVLDGELADAKRLQDKDARAEVTA
jgi:hypothetical protein